MKKNLIYGILLLCACLSNGKGQVLVNRVFQESSGTPSINPLMSITGIGWTASITDGSGNIYTVGHTTVSGAGENLYISKRNSTGTLLFEKNKNTVGTNNDYATAVAINSNGNIIVCGTTDNNGSTNYDGLLYIFDPNSGGTLDSLTFAGGAGLNDIAVDVKPDGAGNILLLCASESGFNNYNYVVSQYNAPLAQVWSASYDYAGLMDIPLGININGSNLEIIGASASSLFEWDYATAIFNLSTGFYFGDVRTNLPGVGYSQPLAFKKDVGNNVFITGKGSINGTDYDIFTVKITPSNAIAWTRTVNLVGGEDVGNTIDIDANNDIIVGGYVTNAANHKELLVLKYDSSGTLLWQYQLPSENISGDAYVKALKVNTLKDVYFVAGQKGNTGNDEVIVTKLHRLGSKIWNKIIVSNYNHYPTSINLNSDGSIYVSSIKNAPTPAYLTTKYAELELDTARTFFGGVPRFQKKQLIVSFLPTAIDTAFINNRQIEYGKLSNLLSPAAYTVVNDAFQATCRNCEIKVVKIYDGMKTTDSIAVSRLGENVPIPSFWATLLLEFPSTISLSQARTILRSLRGIVSFEHPCYSATPDSPPNDSLYNLQASLHPLSPNTSSDINVEEAWTVFPNCGASFIRGGVFDAGVEWRHKDFGYNGSATSGKVNGWNFPHVGSPLAGVNLRNLSGYPPDPDGHGTRVSGIIGALRNNTSGIAGIAGGNMTTSNKGVSLYSLNTSNTNIFYMLKAWFATSGGDLTKQYSYRLNFSNHSYRWGPYDMPPDSMAAYRDQVHFANRMQVTLTASRGNLAGNNIQYPSCFDSSWVISVGGSGTNGLLNPNYSYGSKMDVIAPGDSNLITSTHNNLYYSKFWGSSAAAPHAAGVVGLLMSYLNDSTDNYKNLAPEDCEFIVQRSATDVGPAGYDSINAYGRLNAGKALRMVEKPLYLLYHFGTNFRSPYTITKSVYSNVDTIKLTERYQNPLNLAVYNVGKYIVKTFQINATVSQVHYGTDSLMYFWPRHSSSYVFDRPNAQKKVDLHERVKVNSCNFGSASLTGYIYQVKDSTGAPIGWWPCDTSFNALYVGNGKPKTLMEYSILVKNKGLGVRQNTRENLSVNVFPNPAGHQQTLAIETDKESNCTVDLYDLMGQFIKTVYKGRTFIGKTDIIHNLDNLSSGLYIYVTKLDDNIISTKFVKE
jgi:hypothetical protein